MPALADAGAAPDWMSGYWLSCAQGEQVSETWVGSGSGVLVGVNHTRAQRVGFEFLRIARNADGRQTYFAMPGGSKATAFLAVEQSASRIVFENTGHDFPQRIIYARNGDDLSARIEGVINGQERSQEWRFRRAPVDTQCR